MKKVIILLVAVSVFMLCASVGYSLATRTASFIKEAAGVDIQPGETQNSTNVVGKNSCLLSIQVDRLDVQRPRLVSVWATYLYFDDQPNKINFLPVFFPSMTSENAKVLDRNFALNDHGEPASSFWRAFDAYKVDCKDYLMIDEYGVIKVLNWVTGRMDMESVLMQNAGNLDGIQGLLEEACDKVTDSAGRQMPPFHWSDLAPGHIRTNLTMDTALLYWEHAVNAPSPGTCAVLK